MGAEVALVLAIGSAIAGAVNAEMGAQEAKRQARYNRDYNIDLANKKAEQERLNQEQKTKAERDQAKRRRELIKAQTASSGVAMEGTPEEMLLKQVETDEMNIQQSIQESEQRINQYYHDGQMAEYEYGVLKTQIRQDRNQAVIGAVATSASAMSTYSSNGSTGKKDGKGKSSKGGK